MIDWKLFRTIVAALLTVGVIVVVAQLLLAALIFGGLAPIARIVTLAVVAALAWFAYATLKDWRAAHANERTAGGSSPPAG